MRETAWLALGVVGAVVGVVLVRWGWWARRVGTVQRCAGCGYDLTGNESGRCSECGAEVGEGRVTVGDRRRRPVVAVMGLCFLLVGIGVVGYPGVERLRRVDWYRYRPQGWVAGDLSSSDGVLAERAWEELERRRKEGGLSEETEARVAEAALGEQGKAHVPENIAPPPLFEPMMRYLSDRCSARKLTEAQRERFFRQAFRAELRIPAEVVSGDDVDVTAVPTGNSADDGRWSNWVKWGTLTVGDERVSNRGSAGGQNLRAVELRTHIVVRGSGKQDVTWVLPTTVHQTSGDPMKDGPVVFRFDRVLHATTTVKESH